MLHLATPGLRRVRQASCGRGGGARAAAGGLHSLAQRRVRRAQTSPGRGQLQAARRHAEGRRLSSRGCAACYVAVRMEELMLTTIAEGECNACETLRSTAAEPFLGTLQWQVSVTFRGVN